MNSVVLSGRLTKKPDLRSTAGGTVLCNFSLAVDRDRIREDGTRETDFIDCTCFGKTAENLNKYQDKGALIELKGRMQTDKYTNKDGKNVYKTFVCVETIKYLSKPETKEYERKNDEKNIYEQFGEKVQSEFDLPF